MAGIELSVFIRAPLERVWDIISDLDTQERWMEDVHSLEVVYRPTGGPGAVIKVTTSLFGVPLLHDVMVITRLEPPRLLEVVHCGEFSGSGAFRLEPAEGGTTFIWEETFVPPLGQLGEMTVERVIEPHLRQVWGRSMENVRRLAEAEPKQA
jgi:uncharacterized protein YndB with AHSA1/START domain